MPRTKHEKFERVLVVEDDPRLAQTITEGLRARGWDTRSLTSSEEVVDLLMAGEWIPDIMVLDYTLADGRADTILDHIERCCGTIAFPQIILVSGTATLDEAGELWKRGIRESLGKPLDLRRLYRLVDEVATESRSLEAQIRSLVRYSQISLEGIKSQSRHLMFDEALAITRKQVRAAARILGVTRQAVQQFKRDRNKAADGLPEGHAE